MTYRAVVARREPLLPFTFVVHAQPLPASTSWVTVAGCKSLSGLAMNVGAYEIWEGGNSLHRYAHPDKVTWEPITLEQGLECGDTLRLWAEAVRQYATDGSFTTAQPIKRNLIIQIYDVNNVTNVTNVDVLSLSQKKRNQVGPDNPTVQYQVFNAWISKYRALPKLDGMTSDLAFESVEFVHEGWKRMDPTSSGQESPSPLNQPGGPDLANPNSPNRNA